MVSRKQAELPRMCVRVAELPAKLRLSRYAFAKSLGMKSQSGLNNIIVRGSIPGGAIIEAICREHGVSADWLVMGAGPWKKNGKKLYRDYTENKKES